MGIFDRLRDLVTSDRTLEMRLYDAFRGRQQQSALSRTPSPPRSFGSPSSGAYRPLLKSSTPAYRPPVAPRAQESGLNQLFNELLAGMGQSNILMPSDSELRNQAQLTVNAQYDPQITALQQAMKTAQGNATRGKAGIRDIYSALSKDYAAEVPKQKAEHAQAKAGAAQRTKELKQSLANEYNTRLKEQQQMMQQLGIEEAAPAVIPEQQRDLSFFQNTASTEGAQEQQYLSSLDQSMGNYLTTGKSAATLEGSNRQADLETELQNYLRENTSQLTGLQAQKKQAFSATLSQLQNELQKQAAQMQQQNFTNALSLGRFKLDIEQANKASAAPKPYSRGLLGAGEVLNQSVGASQGTNLMGVLQDVLGSQQLREGKFSTGRQDRYGQPDYTSMTPEQAASLVREEAMRRGLGPTETLALTNAMLAYYGRLGG